jgi:hypothetical protein
MKNSVDPSAIYAELKLVDRVLFDRFWSKVDVRGPSECWPWMSSVDSPGYAQFCVSGSNRRASRVVHFMMSGQWLPSSVLVLHSCDNRKCVNPAHLRAGTHADNMRDKVERGRGRGRGGAHKLRGHLDELVSRYEAGDPVHTLCAEYGVTRQTVQYHMRKRRLLAAEETP